MALTRVSLIVLGLRLEGLSNQGDRISSTLAEESESDEVDVSGVSEGCGTQSIMYLSDSKFVARLGAAVSSFSVDWPCRLHTNLQNLESSLGGRRILEIIWR